MEVDGVCVVRAAVRAPAVDMFRSGHTGADISIHEGSEGNMADAFISDLFLFSRV